MFSSQHLTRGLWIATIVAFVAGAGFVPAARAQADVTLTVVGQSLEFQDDTTLAVDVEVTGTVALAGLEFVVSYPEELLPAVTDAPGTGTLWGSVEVNYDFADADLTPPAGRRYAAVIAASATNVASTDGTVVTLEFPVTCAGNAQNFPTGREITISVVATDATTVVPDADGDGFDDLASAVVATEDGTINLNCTTVSGDAQSFGTLKSVFGTTTEVR